LGGDAATPRVAIVGCGRITREGHLPAWIEAARAGRCELVAVADRDASRAAVAADMAGVAAYGALDELLAATQPDIVHVATLLDSHRDLAVGALRAGCHVLCEKPIARDAAEATAMVAAAEEAGRLLSICFQSRCLPAARYLRDVLASGELGAVLSVRTWGTDVRGLPVNRTWPPGGGGALSHFTSHNIDLALWLLGFPPVVSVSAMGWQRLPRIGVESVPMSGGLQRADALPAGIEDAGWAFIRLASGALITVEANFLARPASRQTGYEVLAERGTAALMPLEVWRDEGDAWVDATPNDGLLAPEPDGMAGLIHDFLSAVASGGPSPTRGPEIVAVQRVMDAIYRSVRSGREVLLAGI
jgi:predicted dehydrogenase